MPIQGDRKHRDTLLNATDPHKRQAIEDRTAPKGLWCQPINEKGGCEYVYPDNPSSTNAQIVIGRDRDASLESGFGGKGYTQCGMIDLVAGRMSSYRNEDGEYGPPDSNIYVGSNFFADAARVYISQKTEIDDYFGLARGSERVTSKAKSGIGIKADHVRIIGREHIKIITGLAKVEGASRSGELNAGGGVIDTAGRIDLIAGNYTEERSVGAIASLIRNAIQKLIKKERVQTLQPIPKGDNLVMALEEILDVLTSITSMIYANQKGIMELSTAVAQHWHPAPPTVATPEASLGASIIPTFFQALEGFLSQPSMQYNIGVVSLNHLKPLSPRYINSRHCFAT